MRRIVIGFVLAVSGCDDDDCCELRDAGVDVLDPAYMEVARVPAVPRADVDVLFVIDDSPSTQDMQAALRMSFPQFINVVESLPSGLPNLHLGVVTTDLGTRAANDASPGPGIGSGPGSCSGTGKSGNLTISGSTLVTGTFISDVENSSGTRDKNYTGTLAEAFSSIAAVGSSGCGFEQPIEAAKVALGGNANNAGFVRQDASLAIVMVADEDDCSISHTTVLGSDTNTLGPLQSFRCTRFGVTCDVNGATSDEMNQLGGKDVCHSASSDTYIMPIDPYVPFFTGLKTDPSRLLFSVITGPPTPFAVEQRTPPGGGTPINALARSCTYTGASGLMAVADPGVRIRELAARMPNNTVASVCSADLSDPLRAVARGVRAMVGDPCFTRDIAQPVDCVVVDISGGGQRTIPACSETTTADCYMISPDPVACTTTQQLRVEINRSTTPPDDTVVSVRCRL